MHVPTVAYNDGSLASGISPGTSSWGIWLEFRKLGHCPREAQVRKFELCGKTILAATVDDVLSDVGAARDSNNIGEIQAVTYVFGLSIHFAMTQTKIPVNHDPNVAAHLAVENAKFERPSEQRNIQREASHEVMWCESPSTISDIYKSTDSKKM